MDDRMPEKTVGVSRIVARAMCLVAFGATLAACPPNSLLTDVQQQVQDAHASSNQTVSTPTFSPTTGTYSSNQSVTIANATPGAAIHYTSTTGGDTPPDPTAASPVYSSPILVSGNTTIMTIKAIAIKSGMIDSTVVTAI